ncbi:DUF3347 domain-containing protein [Pedobacter xixiisoli]|uniref:DUF3347 domain-containing protein n=1 Tax=Pedobacter xixiisoli TaxID=1476464 RepID=A0A285ZPG9_9SPHI|nr:DUF3347 domain-containing protein [Pedobacter xixiisoli]SOD11518.1 Protein of unknown function [Pedobacter xixiisoli]
MKKNIILLAALAMLLVACSNQKTEEKKDTTVAKEQTKVTAVNPVSLKNDQLNAVYQQYLLLSSALINSDLATAKEASMALELGAKALAGGEKLAGFAAKITAASDIEVQRALFSSLSNEMIAKVKATGLQSGEVYVEYCPMAMNDKGASWLSNQKEVRNPYYGESMLDCGEIKETLK